MASGVLFRSFVTALWGDDVFSSEADEVARDAFRRQVMMRVAPEVPRRGANTFSMA